MKNNAKSDVNNFVRIAVAIAALGGLLFGYDTGVISGAILFIKTQFSLSSTMEEIVVSAVLIGAVIGAIIGGALTERCGRRALIIRRRHCLYVKRHRHRAGAERHVADRGQDRERAGYRHRFLYLADVHRRVGASKGSRFCSVICSRSPRVSWSRIWRTMRCPASKAGGMFALAAIPSILLTVAMWYLPDSPRWLISRSRVDQARQILLRARTNLDVNPEIADIQKGFKEQGAGGLAGLFQPSLRMPLMVGVGLAVFQQITGINTVIYYAPTIFKFTGIAATGPAILAGAALTMVMWLGRLRARRCLRIKNSEGLEPSSLEWRLCWRRHHFRHCPTHGRSTVNIASKTTSGVARTAAKRSPRVEPTVDNLCINTIRTLSMDAVQQANSGHPGTPMALAPVIYTLWQSLFVLRPKRSDLAEP